MEKWIDEAFARACEKLERGAKRAAEQGIIPYMGQKDGYTPAPFDGNSWWTGGFWPGMMWQLYAATGRDVYRDEALRVEKLLTDELRSFMLLNHDVGFMYLLSTGAHDRLIGDAQAYVDTLHAATLLAGRFNPTGFIRAWPQPDRAGYAIIDDEACRRASEQEIIRRYYKGLVDLRIGREKPETVEKLKLIMQQLNLRQADRSVVLPALEKSNRSVPAPAPSSTPSRCWRTSPKRPC